MLDVPFLIRRFFGLLHDNPANFIQTCRMILLILGGVVYLLIPFDIVPEVVFGVFGLLDDLIVVLVAIFMVTRTFR